jgi:hypothetical protein
MAPHSAKQVSEKPKNLIVNGLIPTIEYQMVKACAEDLYKKCPDVFTMPSLNGMLEFDWNTWLVQKKLVR